MSEPRRLIEDAQGLAARVLSSASEDDPTPQRRRKLVASSAVLTATTAASAASGATIAKILVGVAVTSALAVGYGVREHDPVVPAEAPASPIAPPTLHLPDVASVASVTVVAPVAPSASVSAPRAKAQPIPSVAPNEPAANASIDREIELVDHARKQLESGDAKGSLASLARYDAEHPGGVLAIEVAVLRIEATAAAGDGERAAQLARSFATAHPGSPHVGQVKKFIPAQ